MRYIAALVALIALALSFLAKSVGMIALLLVVCTGATLLSLAGFVESRISASAKSQVYLPTPEERALLVKRSDRLRQEHEQRLAQGRRPETQAPSRGPDPPASA